MTSLRGACRVQVVGSIAFATTARAPYGPAELSLACEQTVGQLNGRAPSVYVADFRASTWRLRTLHLDALFDDADPTIECPAALVVPPDRFELFRAHAWNVAHGGIMRKVFTDYPRAVAWAQARATLASRLKTVP